VSVLGQVNRSGSYPIQTTTARLSQMLAEAGGQTPLGADQVVLTGTRDGQPFRREIDIDALYKSPDSTDDLQVAAGDTIYVPRAPLFYIYGEVIKPGEYRVMRDMTMRQAIATGGGLTLRGTERRLKVVRMGKDGTKEKISVGLDDPVQPGDVVYVAESLF
jgi:polysaccharide export outer membrane protein